MTLYIENQTDLNEIVFKCIIEITEVLGSKRNV